MRVLYVTHYTEMLGANRSMLQLIIELRERGVVPTVLLPVQGRNFKSELRDLLIQHKIECIEAPIRMVKHPVAWKSVLNYGYSIWLRRKVLREIGDRCYDIIHTNSSVIDIGSYLAKKLHAKHVWHLREFGDLDYNFKTPFGKWYQRVIYNGSNQFIAISKKIASHYSQYIPKSNINLIYNGIKVGEVHEHVRHNSIKFCVLGLLHENKRQLDVVKAINELVNKRHLVNLHLYIIGNGQANYVKVMKDYIKKNALSSFITFMGHRNDVAQLLPTMDVGIMSSYNEAFGRVTVEYMMAGLAVIATDGGANCEIIEDGKSGLIYPAGNYIFLADKMSECMADGNSVADLSRNGYERAISVFSSEKNSNQILNLYNKIIY